MFILTQVPSTRKGTVNAEIHTDYDDVVKVDFDIECKVETIKEVENKKKEIKDDVFNPESPVDDPDYAFVEYYLVDVFNVRKDKEKQVDIPFSKDQLDILMDIHDIRVALVNKVSELVNRTDLISKNLRA